MEEQANMERLKILENMSSYNEFEKFILSFVGTISYLVPYIVIIIVIWKIIKSNKSKTKSSK